MSKRSYTGDVEEKVESITIDAFKKEKEQLEIDLISLIGNRVKTFKEKTDYAPSAIDVVMVDLTDLGSKHKEFAVGNVHVNIEL